MSLRFAKKDTKKIDTQKVCPNGHPENKRHSECEFLSHSFRIGLIPPVNLGGMRLGTVSLTEGQPYGTVFRLRIIYILRIPTFRGGISAQSFMEMLMIGTRQFFQLLTQFSGREAENPRLWDEPSSSKGGTLVNHFMKNISVLLLREFQSPNTVFFLTLGKVRWRALYKGISDLKTTRALRESSHFGPPGFHLLVGLFPPQRCSCVGMHFREGEGLQFAIRQMFPSTLSLMHQIFKALPLILNLVKNEFGNVRERGEEGSVVVFRQPISSSVKQSKQLTVGELVS